MYKMLKNLQLITPFESRWAPGSRGESSSFALDVALLIQTPLFLEDLKMPGSCSLCTRCLANAADEVSQSKENAAINTTLINRRKSKLFLEVGPAHSKAFRRPVVPFC